jgi:hypothetical protein
MENVGILYDHLEYFTAVCYSLWSFGIFFPIWYVWIKKNLATLICLTVFILVQNVDARVECQGGQASQQESNFPPDVLKSLAQKRAWDRFDKDIHTC